MLNNFLALSILGLFCCVYAQPNLGSPVPAVPLNSTSLPEGSPPPVPANSTEPVGGVSALPAGVNNASEPSGVTPGAGSPPPLGVGGLNGTEAPPLGGSNGTSIPPELEKKNATGAEPVVANNETVSQPPPAAVQNVSVPGPVNGSEPAVVPGNATEPAAPGNPIEPIAPGNATEAPSAVGANTTAPVQPGNNTGSEAPAAAVSGHGETKEGELPPPDNVKFFIVGFRHGNRNPAQFLKGDTTHDSWAWEGASQLTSIGRRQGSALGQFLRKRYGHIVPDEYFPSKIKAYSSSAERCQQTLQSVMLGFYPPVWKKTLLWQPVPYEISDPLLRMYNVEPCPGYKSAYQEISDDSGKGADTWLKRENPELLKYIAEKSGLNASLSDLADVADNIGNMRLFNQPLPDWITNPTLKGFSAKEVFSAVMSFAEAHQVLCANDSACARMMAGLWLDQIVQTLNQASKGALKGRLANFYTAHTETVLSLIRLVKAKGVLEMPTSAGFVLEYADQPAPSVRFIFHEPDPNNPDIRLAEIKELEFATSEWVPLEKFVEAVKGPSFSSWQEACGLPKCPA